MKKAVLLIFLLFASVNPATAEINHVRVLNDLLIEHSGFRLYSHEAAKQQIFYNNLNCGVVVSYSGSYIKSAMLGVGEGFNRQAAKSALYVIYLTLQGQNGKTVPKGSLYRQNGTPSRYRHCQYQKATK